MPLTTYTAGEVLTASSLNANFAFAAGGAPMAIFNETQAGNTNGGGATSGSFIKRTLNTTIQNGITGCSIASSVITLPAGTYYVQASAPFGYVDLTKIKLRNTTDSTDAIIGQSVILPAGGTAFLTGYFTIAASKDFELQYRVAVTQATVGLGYACNFGISEVYSVISIQKVA